MTDSRGCEHEGTKVETASNRLNGVADPEGATAASDRSITDASISSSTAESEIKALNHALKSNVIPLRGILNHMGWTQAPLLPQGLLPHSAD